MPGQAALITGVIIVAAIAAVAGAGWLYEHARGRALQKALLASAASPLPETVDFAALEKLPPPVARYFSHVLPQGQRFIRIAAIYQSGILRTGAGSNKWFPFTARQYIAPMAKGFVWNARVKLPFGAHIRILDSCIAGTGSGRISLLSAFPIAAETGTPELNLGTLHRYLAEAVWCPTALLPQSGVAWAAIDEQSALATLRIHDLSVSLEFRFNQMGEVTSIFTPGRFARIDGKYQQLPWEGRFADYQLVSGIRVPRQGEAGWHIDGALEMVWKGEIVAIQYDAAIAEVKES
ncbi:DUF6920 family protein [Thiolapillus sp.]